MIPDRLFTAHLKVFNMANRFDRPMVLLSLPVLVMDFREVVAFKRHLFWQVNHVIALTTTRRIMSGKPVDT